MRDRVGVILGICAIGLIPALNGQQEAQATQRQHDRGVWVWKTQAEEIITEKNARAAFFDFCDKPHGYPEKAFTHIYLHVNPTRLKSSDPCLPDFIQEAHDSGLKVEYLCGTPEWATEVKRANGEDRARGFLEYNKNLPSSQRFDGLHFDVEPFLLNDWPKNAGVYWRQYIELLKNCRQQVNDYNSNYSPPISFACDIPAWYDTEDMNKPASGPFTSHEQVQEIVDYIVVMDYYDDTDEIVTHALEEIKYGMTLGKSVVIGVLTGIPKGGAPRNTFLEEGRHYMEEQLHSAAYSFAPYASFKGFAFHDYESYKNLLLDQGITKSSPIPGITEKSAYIVYYGNWNQDRVNQAKKFDLVILHPNTNITPAWIAQIRSGLDDKSTTADDVIVLGYLSLGEDDVESPRTGDGRGPGGYASWYMDKIDPKDMPDKNGQWGSFYTDAGNAQWQKFLKESLPSDDSPAGSDHILRTLGCDGLFLDTLDTASPWGPYGHTAGSMSFLIKAIRIWYPDKILVVNRGLFYYSSDTDDGVNYSTWSPHEYINGVIFECYYTEWDWDKNMGVINPLFPDNNKTTLSKELNNTANGPNGFTVFCLDYISKDQLQYQKMLDIQIQEALGQQKWTDYIGDILLDTMRTDVLDYLDGL